MKGPVIATLLLATWPCYGQQGTTGELTGIVRSEGQPLAGVTVTLASAALPGNRVAITGENGGYLFSFVPPADCVVRFELQGFMTAEKSVSIRLAVTTRADADLRAAPLGQEIVVQAGASTAGLSSITTNVGRSVLQQLPGARDIGAVTQLSPAVNTLGQRNALVIAGAPSWDSLYIIDGVAANEYLTGQPHNVVLEDAIEEVAVLSGAIPAEYGRFTGGVVSTVTKSGGNEFDGSFRDTVTNPRWTAATPWPGEPRPASDMNQSIEATLGGFAVRDRLWFFAGFLNADSTLQRFTLSTNIPYSSPSRDHRWQTKLTGVITPRDSIVVSYADDLLEEKNALDTRGGGTVLDLASLTADRKQPVSLAAATYSGMLAADLTAEVQASQKRSALRGNGGLSTDRIAGTLIMVRGSGNANAPFGCGICGDDARDSQSLAARTSLYRNTRWGNHTLVAGVEKFGETRTNAGTRSSSEYTVVANSATIKGQNVYPIFLPSRTTATLLWTQPYPGDEGSHLNTSSAYINDRWDLNGVASLNAGFRYDRNDASDAAGNTISNDASWSPRLGATIDLTRDGCRQLVASYGRYAAKILEGGGSSQQVGTFNQYGWTYGGAPINGPGTPVDQLLTSQQALAALFAWFDSVGGIRNHAFLQFITTPDTTSVFHGSLQSPSVDEVTVGYTAHFPHGSVRADVITRDWHHFYAARVDHTTGQSTDPGGKPIDVVWVVNDNSGTVRRYRALQIEGNWQSGRLSAGGGYVLSSLRGNDDEEEGVTLSAPRNLPLSFWYPELFGYPQRKPYGYLRENERHRLRAWMTYERGPLSAFVLQRFDSGHPYSAESDFNPVQAGLPTLGYALNQIVVAPYYFSARGAYRTDNVYDTDASVQVQLSLRSARLFAKLDVLNLFDNAAVVAPNVTVLDAARNGPPFKQFNPFTETPVAGVNYQLGPNFGKPTGPDSYQTPRTYQIAVGARF